MKITPVMTNVMQSAKKGIDTVGSTTLNGVGSAKKFVASHVDEFVKKENVAKVIEAAKKNKNTIVGAGVLAAALILAGSAVKSIIDKVNEIRNKD